MSAALSPLARAVAGALVVVLGVSSAYAGSRIALGALDDRYVVAVELGDLGQGLVTGSDVKIRGVIVGSIGEFALTEEYTAMAELVLRPQYRIPERSTFLVSGKTLFGEKQVEIIFDGPVGEGPFLPDGAVVADPARVVEVEDVVAALAEVVSAIDPDDLAVVFDNLFAAFSGMGAEIARSIDEGARATRLLAATIDDQVRNTRDFSLVAEALGPVGGDFNRLGREVRDGMPVIADNQLAIRRLLDGVRGFTRQLDATFRVNRADIDRIIVRGDNPLRLLYHYRVELGEVVKGVHDYAEAFDEGFTHEGILGQAAYFQIILEGEDFEAMFCQGLPEQMASQIPGCDQAHAAAQRAEDGTVALPLPRDLVRPDVPSLLGLDALLRRALDGPDAPLGAGQEAA